MELEDLKNPSRFQKHTNILIWKSFLQRQRRWKILLFEGLFAGILFLSAVFIANPVFLTPLQAEPEPPLTAADILVSLNRRTIMGYAPNTEPFAAIMGRAAKFLNISFLTASSENGLNDMLFDRVSEAPLDEAVMWIIWETKINNTWKLSIRSTDRAKYETSIDHTRFSNPHLRVGFLAVQLAILQAIIENAAGSNPNYELTLVSMPVSPLMKEALVRKTLSGILLCFTLAFIPPVLETEALIVTETLNGVKRALRLRNVLYSSMYIGWLVYAYLTVLPISLLASVTLILVFRWIHLMFALLVVLVYVSVMIMHAFIMAMFHNKAWLACIWTTLFTFLQMYLAELLVHHHYDLQHTALTLFLNLIVPQLGLIHSFNQFALLQTGISGGEESSIGRTLSLTIGSWSILILFCFALLMILQRTIGQDRAIGGQMSWNSILFKSVEGKDKLCKIEAPSIKEREKLQEVDELVAKAISFNEVTKSIMGIPVLSNVTMDLYRGEYSVLFAERIQHKMMLTLEDLLTGLALPDKGSINILGRNVRSGENFLTESHMVGYCHRSSILFDDLTVHEHFTFFLDLCLWQESNEYVYEYGHIRSRCLLSDCDLETVQHERIGNLEDYYKAQLCWALALLLEPRIIIIPHFMDEQAYRAVIIDKIIKYRRYLTILKFSFSSLQLEYADRVFLFDNKILVFGGTPAYMFFKYGREYKLRLTLRSGGALDTTELLEKSEEAGATVRAHLGSLLILKLPTTPTDKVTAFIRDLTENATKFGVIALNISLPDSEEICRRAMADTATEERSVSRQISENAIKRITEPVDWQRDKTYCTNVRLLRSVAWKYFTFYVHYRLFLIITLLSTLLAGVFIGLSLSTILSELNQSRIVTNTMKQEVLNAEGRNHVTTLVLRTDNSSAARSVANAYVFSEPNSTVSDIGGVVYMAIPSSESLTEYLVTRAIDSPQQYVNMHAYGMDVATAANGVLKIQALYSPLHYDVAAAAKTLARAYVALLRHYTGKLDATIQFTDDPLELDLTPWMMQAETAPLLIQCLLILTISHTTLLPSREHGLIRHLQSHAMNFSPARYWFTLYFCDLIMYWILVMIISVVMVSVLHIMAPAAHYHYGDMVVVPFMLIVYGLGCIPQAYLFSLGRRPALNSMTFVIINVVFGETTILMKIFEGEILDFFLQFMVLSPQYNMANAFVKIKQIFLYNSECTIFKRKNLCSTKTFHKCCPKCGILQKCFTRKSYLAGRAGILKEIIQMLSVAVLYISILLVLEYKVLQRMWTFVWELRMTKSCEANLRPGAQCEMNDALDKTKRLRIDKTKMDTFGEYLLALNVTKKMSGYYVVHNVYLGMRKGEIVALSGLKRHGRLTFCQVLAGHLMPSRGQLQCMSQWSLKRQPHLYCQQIAISCSEVSLPTWMTAYDALELIGTLRGVPKDHIKRQLNDLIEALDLLDLAHTRISRMLSADRSRVRFAAAIIGAPPILILDECTVYQKFFVQRAMYSILYDLKKKGHGLLISSSIVESHLPMTNRLAFIIDGTTYDIGTVDSLVDRYSQKGYTVVVHLKDDVDVTKMFGNYFDNFIINDTSEVLVNVQILDSLNWMEVFDRMEKLKTNNVQVYSYVVTEIPIDFIYNSILSKEQGNRVVEDLFSYSWLKTILPRKLKRSPSQRALQALSAFEPKYAINTLKELPWSVIFHR
ncbi:cholesterol transporter ABCA5 isoform X1 [Bombyx mori]|uniref:ABC transporter domain-containing protein n=1 Tax=Bombyx mori TaxID=7091 RepID=A0A8R2C960_BOMMO|nr:ATP-binding cassette sub-family A member 5 isoform X1 [Bombyx mori]